LGKKHKKQLPRPKITPAALYRQGLVYFEQDDFDMAANIFGRLAREFPKSRYVNEAWLMLGRAELQTSRYPYAIPDLTKATAGEPSLAARAFYYLGLAYGRRGDYDNAIVNLKKVSVKAELAAEAAYWAAYYYELKGDVKTALLEYYNMLKNFPNSDTAAAAIWRIGRIYYWSGDYQNAAKYLHLAQQFRRSEDAPRCYFFEAKALEKLGKKGEAQATYRKLLEQYDHTYYAYRARQVLGLTGSATTPFAGEDFSEALSGLTGRDTEKLAAIMEIWEETKAEELNLVEDPETTQWHLNKYRELMRLGLIDYAAEEARYLVNLTSEQEKDTAQTKLGELLVGSGSYNAPIKYADRKVKKAILDGSQQQVSPALWRMAYPRAYWSLVSGKAKKYRLDPLLALAVIREESRFRPSAVSRSGARGLMQIMPKTGRGLAKSLKLKPYRTARLFEPSVNVELGSCFLADLIKESRGNIYLALAGYNGGPNRVKRYLKEWYDGDYDKLDVDEFIETIPIRETRLYVQKVMASYFEYQRLYD
jgi:soluble lytic murein transglycosylase